MSLSMTNDQVDADGLVDDFNILFGQIVDPDDCHVQPASMSLLWYRQPWLRPRASYGPLSLIADIPGVTARP